MREILSSIEAECRRYKALGEGAIQQVHETEFSRDTGGNSVAILVWHIGGNLKSRYTDFLKSDGEKTWRDRDSEFDPRNNVTRAELLEKWNSGWNTFFAAVEPLTDADLSRSVVIRGVEFRLYEALHRNLAHLSYHVGQIVFLAKEFRGSEWKTLSIPRGKSEEYNRNPNPAREKAPKN